MSHYAVIGLVTGVVAEQYALLPDRPRSAEMVRGLTINTVVAGQSGVDRRHETVIHCCTAGLGKVNGALAAAALAAHADLDLLAIIGTAGNIGGLAPGAYLLHEATHGDYGAYRNGGFEPYRAGTLPIGPADTSPFASAPAARLLTADPDLPHARIVTGDSFVEDADRSRALAASSGAGLVDMETAAVAQVADRLGLDWLGVKAISDDADADSATDFAQQLAFASDQAAQLFVRLLGLD